jgi:hypothetical protein
VGVVGFIGGRIVGCDIIPDPGVFAEYFDQLVRSYTLDGGYLKSGRAGDVNYAEESGRFLSRLRGSETKSFKSPGLGTSEQFRADSGRGGAAVCGSALVHEGCISAPSPARIGGPTSTRSGGGSKYDPRSPPAGDASHTGEAATFSGPVSPR